MAFDAFMKIDDIQGETQDGQFKDWIELKDFDASASNTAMATSTPSRGHFGRSNLSDFFISKLVDKATPKLHEACWSGKRFKEVTIAVNRAGGDDKIKYLEIKLEEVFVSSVSLNANGTEEGGFPTESVRLSFGRIKMDYLQSLANGQRAGHIVGGWDAIGNKAYA